MQENWQLTELTESGSRAEIMTIRSKESEIFDYYYRKVAFAMRPHAKLDVWKRAIDFVVAVYKTTESFPRAERFGLLSRIRRAAVSIPANIAEGAARHTSKEFKYVVSNAQGSVSELATELLIAQRLGYLKE